MTRLENWLAQATRRLSQESAARVRSEIQDHYESAREAALNAGATAEQADCTALTALGDARTANCQYCSVLLTSSEAAMLRQGNWEAGFVCSRSWLKWLLFAIPIAVLAAGVIELQHGKIGAARVLIAGAICMGVLLAGPFLPIYTPERGRLFRTAKWVVTVGMLAVIFGADVFKWTWFLMSCLWPVFYVEWTRESIRRKLPVARWPKQLYL